MEEHNIVALRTAQEYIIFTLASLNACMELGTIKKAALMGSEPQGFAPTPVVTQRFGSPASGGEKNRNIVETFSRLFNARTSY